MEPLYSRQVNLFHSSAGIHHTHPLSNQIVPDLRRDFIPHALTELAMQKRRIGHRALHPKLVLRRRNQHCDDLGHHTPTSYESRLELTCAPYSLAPQRELGIY